MPKIPAQTITAYCETDYRVLAGPPFVLRIGSASEPLKELYRQFGVDCAAFVTACNPCSKDIGEQANAARMAGLKRELERRDLRFFDGEGEHPDGGWPAEPSLLVPGLDLESAKTLGMRHEQNALVWCGADAVPQLVLLR